MALIDECECLRHFRRSHPDFRRLSSLQMGFAPGIESRGNTETSRSYCRGKTSLWRLSLDQVYVWSTISVEFVRCIILDFVVGGMPLDGDGRPRHGVFDKSIDYGSKVSAHLASDIPPHADILEIVLCTDKARTFGHLTAPARVCEPEP